MFILVLLFQLLRVSDLLSFESVTKVDLKTREKGKAMQSEEHEEGEAMEEIFSRQDQKTRINQNAKCKSMEHLEPRLQ